MHTRRQRLFLSFLGDSAGHQKHRLQRHEGGLFEVWDLLSMGFYELHHALQLLFIICHGVYKVLNHLYTSLSHVVCDF